MAINNFLYNATFNSQSQNILLTSSNIKNLLDSNYQKLIFDHYFQQITHSCFVSRDSLTYPS